MEIIHNKEKILRQRELLKKYAPKIYQMFAASKIHKSRLVKNLPNK